MTNMTLADFIRDFLEVELHHAQAREAEDRHAAGYARAPVSPGEFDIWLDEQDWGSP